MRNVQKGTNIQIPISFTNTDTYSISAASNNAGYAYYCIAVDKNHISVGSNASSINLTVTLIGY